MTARTKYGPRFDAVLFDFSGTLFDDGSVVDPERLAADAGRLGCPLALDEAIALCDRVLALADSPAGLRIRAGCDESISAHRAAWTAVAAAADEVVEGLADAFHDCLVDPASWRPYPDALPTLAALRRQGVPVGVVSNIAWDIRLAFERIGALELVGTFTLSCELGVLKPDPAMFLHAAEQLGAPVATTLMVGDNAVTDGAAAAVGMTTLLLPGSRQGDRCRGLGTVLSMVDGA